MVDVEVHMRGAVEDLPLVRRALGSCNGRELRLMKVVAPPQPTSTSLLSFPTHPHLLLFLLTSMAPPPLP